MFTSLFYFFIFSSLFIALCSVLMVHQTNLLFQLNENKYYLLFVFFSTICSYNFHWYLTTHSASPSSRILWAQKHKGYHLTLSFIGLAGGTIFFFNLLQHWFWLLLAAGITFLYSAPKLPHELFRILKQIAIGKTIFLGMVWTYVTTILPLIISSEIWKADMTYFVLSRFFLVYAICILFDYRDRENDKADGIRSMITRLNEKGINYLFILSLTLFCIFTLLLLKYEHSLLNVIMILIPGIIVAALYDYAKKNFSDIFYYFILDGLMMLSALLMLIFK